MGWGPFQSHNYEVPTDHRTLSNKDLAIKLFKCVDEDVYILAKIPSDLERYAIEAANRLMVREEPQTYKLKRGLEVITTINPVAFSTTPEQALEYAKNIAKKALGLTKL